MKAPKETLSPEAIVLVVAIVGGLLLGLTCIIVGCAPLLR